MAPILKLEALINYGTEPYVTGCLSWVLLTCSTLLL